VDKNIMQYGKGRQDQMTHISHSDEILHDLSYSIDINNPPLEFKQNK